MTRAKSRKSSSIQKSAGARKGRSKESLQEAGKKGGKSSQRGKQNPS